nr:glycosyltransferase [Allobranchiibius huperziae]
MIVLKTNVGGMWLMPQIAAMQARHHEVVVAIPQGLGRLRSALDAHSIAVHPIEWDFSPRSSLAGLNALWSLHNFIRRETPDVVFYHLILSALLARLAAIGTPSRTVHMVAGPLYLESRVLATIESIASRLDDAIIAGSEYTERKYAAIGYPASRLRAIPYGVDTQKFDPARDLSQESIADPDTFVCIMVAYFYAPKQSVFRGQGIKGHETMIEAWQQFHAKNPRSRIVFVGSGFDDTGEQYRQRLMNDHQLPGATWISTVSDVRTYYNSADVSVSPSLSENHGAALEASSMGLPVIVSDAGALPEAITDLTGWVFKAGDAGDLLDKLNQAHEEFKTGRLEERGHRARELMVRKFDNQILSNEVVDVLEGTLSSQPPLLVVVEQRCEVRDSTLYGFSSLGALSGLSQQRPVKVLARAAAGTDLTASRPLLPGSAGVVVPWRGISDVLRSAMHLYSHIRHAPGVVVYTPGSISTIAGLITLATRTPLAVVVAGDPVESLAEPVTQGLVGRIQRPTMRAATRLLTSRAHVARYVTRRVLQDRYPTRGEEFGAFSVRRLNYSATARATDNPTMNILTVASLEKPYKGVRELIDAIAAVRARGVRVTLTVAGDGQLRPALQEHANGLLGDSGRFLGHVSSDRLAVEYQRADLFVLNSWAEGLPRALVEAMGSGLPCIATKVGGNEELLELRCLVPPKDTSALADSILAMAESPEQRMVTGKRNAEHARTLVAEANTVHEDFMYALSEFGI